LLPLLLASGCSSLSDFFGTAPNKREPEIVVPLEDRPVEEPISANHFVLESPDQAIVGTPQIVYTTSDDTLSDLARAYGLGYDELLEANPGIDPWLPGENTPVLLPTQFIIPDVAREGIVLNIASKRLFYFPAVPEGQPAIVKTYPIGIGRVGWETPLGSTKVVSKARDPSWYVPLSVRQEHAELGEALPSVVPPGPDNPLGNRVLKLEMPGYLIHGTNQPYGVGMRVSHGCVRLYPENIEYLFELVEVGEPVMIINEPFLMAKAGGEIYLESHRPLQDDAIDPLDRIDTMLEKWNAATKFGFASDDIERAHAIVERSSGMPTRISSRGDNEVLARARVVRNTVKVDPEAPTLAEVRDMIDEAVREAEEELEETSD
jgi:L,D-transpeptidase ErfK/SrfK